MFAEDRCVHGAAVGLGADAVDQAQCTLGEEGIFNHCETKLLSSAFWSDAAELCVFGYLYRYNRNSYLKAEW